ncbi:hypothetical protein LCGC14_2896350, partial [marine sediment metagenome]
MSLKTIQNSFHSQLLMIRSIHRLIHSDNFCIAYSKATKSEKEKIEKDISLLRKGKIVAFPTDTVYGLGVNAEDTIAIDK